MKGFWIFFLCCIIDVCIQPKEWFKNRKEFHVSRLISNQMERASENGTAGVADPDSSYGRVGSKFDTKTYSGATTFVRQKTSLLKSSVLFLKWRYSSLRNMVALECVFVKIFTVYPFVCIGHTRSSTFTGRNSLNLIINF